VKRKIYFMRKHEITFDISWIKDQKINPSFRYNVLIGYAKSKSDGEKIKLLFEKKSDVFK